ncbi:hypothetical protein [Paraglaciecola sp. 25GB23A]|uniref:hypothetical protein n=1 Tax=Paraglaciecola sp. 25GB23A TaxID=3156068 RepID=UPI0032AFAD11
MKAIIKLGLIALITSAMFVSNVLAHGSLEPIHGGVVKEAHDMVFELVREEKSVSLYVRDHGEAYPTTELVAKLVVLASKEKSEASFTPSGGNKMVAAIIINDGAKVLIRVSEGDHHPITIRYSF